MAKVAKKITDTESKTVTFEFQDAENTILEFDLNRCSADTMLQLALHGAGQKIGDGYAGSGDNLEEAIAITQSLIDRLYKGEWKVQREGGEATGRVTDLARALAEVAQRDLPEAVAKLDEMDKGEKSALRKHPKIAAVLARIGAERAAAKLQEAEESGSLGDLF